jgi:hypothetical protein
VIIGGLAAVAVAAAIIAKLLKNKPRKKGQPPPESYILQLSKNEVTINTRKSDSFTATVWKITEDGGYTQAPSAIIRVTGPPGIPGLRLSPSSGSGSLTTTVSLDTASASMTGIITVMASAGGKGGITADVKVKLDAEADIEFD